MQTRTKQRKTILFMMWLFVASFVFMAVSDNTVYAAPEPPSDTTPSISLSSNTVTALVDVGDFNTLKTGNTTISVTTLNPTGYTMTLTTSGASTNLVSGTNTIPTLSSNSSVSSFPVGRWGYSLDNTTYRPAPSVSGSGDTLATTSEANSTANTYTLYIGAKVANTQPSGTYTNTLVITAVANPITYSLSYDANGGSPTPETQTFVTNDSSHTFTISSTEPSKSGYAFKGWCDGTITGNNGTSAPTCSHINGIYITGTSIRLLYAYPTVTLSAMWQAENVTFNQAYANNNKTMSNGYYVMQDMNSTICGSVSEGQDGILRDSRDNKLYYVHKFPISGAEGECWMTQNLDFDISTSNVTTATSDVTANWNSSSTHPPTATSQTIDLSIIEDFPTRSYDPGNLCVEPGANTKTTCDTTVGSANHNIVGNFYVWNAATAGSDSFEVFHMTVNDSICPKNWRLPASYSDSGKSYTKLMQSNFTGSTINDPLYFVMSGGANQTTAGTTNAYFSSTSLYYYITRSEVLSLSPTSYGTYYGDMATRGMYYNIRCVARGESATFTLNYNVNGGTLSPSSQTIVKDPPVSIRLLSTEPTYSGKVFLGWCDEPVSGNPTNGICSGTTYQYYDYYTFKGDASTKTLYAIWSTSTTFNQAYAAAGKSMLSGYYTMQDMTPNICATVAIGEEGILRDSRDNKLYYVGKLPSGECWMTQNLDFDISTSNVTTATSDVSINWNSTSNYPPTATQTTSFSNYNDNGTQSYNPGDYCLSDWGQLDSNYTACSMPNHYHVGNYYQWNAATAGTGATLVDGEAPNSICPKNWQLPTGNSSATIRAYKPYASRTNELAKFKYKPYYFVVSGLQRGTVRSSAGDYITSTPSSSNSSYYTSLVINASAMVLSSYTRKSYDLRLRCVARGTDSNYAIYYNLNGGGVTDVPSTYQEIDYIQSTGTQFINTGVQMNKTDTRNLEFKVYYDQAVTYTFGVNAYLQYPNTARTGGPYIVKDNYNGSTTTQTIYENDTLISTRDWSTYSGANLYIGLFRMGNPDGGWYGNYAQAKLYYAKITDENNNLIRDLVPVRRISDYVVGLYDKVTGNFYTNAGSGTFNSGGNIFNTDTISPQTGTVGASSINTTLSTKNPTKSGYTFYGWCPGTVSNNNSSTVSCSTTSYQPGATYTVASGSGAIKMNAMWYSANTTRTFYLNFNMNSGSDTVTNIPANITTTSSSSSVTFSIPNTIPIRTGYTFIGWSTSSSATTPSYYAGGTFTTSNTNNTLYAVWRLSMQNWTGCNSLAVGSTIELADTRDREIYLIGKLADNHCWMLDNLRLDPSQASVKSILSSTNTNANDTALNYFKNGGGSSPYATSAISSSWATSFTAPYVYVSSKDTVATHYGSGTGKIGVYYNFCAASAGSYCYADGAGVNVASTYKDAQYDICPAGWRMPIGDVGGEYGTLYTSYSYNLTNFRTSLSTTLSGWYAGGTPSNVNSIVYYLTSTYGTTSAMYIYQFNTTDVNASLAAGRQYGLSVRCMMESTTTPTIYRVAYRLTDDIVGNSLPSSCNMNEWCIVPNPTRSGYKFLGWQISNMNPGQNHYFMFNTDSTYQTTTAEEFPIVDSAGTSSTFYMWNARTTNGTVVLAPAWQVL